MGLGYNYLAWAARARGTYYMLVNGDNDISEATLRVILDRLGTADAVIPYVENQEDRPFIRCVVSKCFVFMVNLLSGNRVRYYNGPVLHRRSNVVRFRLGATGFGYQAELLCRVLHHGCTSVQVPFRFAGSDEILSSAFKLRNLVSVAGSVVRIFLYRIARPSGSTLRETRHRRDHAPSSQRAW
jgi:hypothetical protein